MQHILHKRNTEESNHVTIADVIQDKEKEFYVILKDKEPRVGVKKSPLKAAIKKTEGMRLRLIPVIAIGIAVVTVGIILATRRKKGKPP